MNLHVVPTIQNDDSAAFQTYRRILKRARFVPKKHLPLLQHLGASRKLPSGRASVSLFDGLTDVRPFDAYGRPVKREDFREEVADVILPPPEAHGDLRKVREREMMLVRQMAMNDVDEDVVMKPMLSTAVWKIGEKERVFGPPGLAPPVRGVLNSEGNESFFSYDGMWKNGNMEGEGVYQFSDGSLYRGLFKRNLPDGHGTATYDGGTIYIGDWKNGYPHGEGRCTYHGDGKKEKEANTAGGRYSSCGGIVYEGEWKEGRRHGKGTLTYPNGSHYTGGFFRGRFHGKGTFYSKNTAVTYSGCFERGFVVGRGTATFPDGRKGVKVWPRASGGDTKKTRGDGTSVTVYEAMCAIRAEWEDRTTAKFELDQQLYGTINDVKLEKHIDNVRAEIKEERRREKQRIRMEKERKIREARLLLLQKKAQQDMMEEKGDSGEEDDDEAMEESKHDQN